MPSLDARRHTIPDGDDTPSRAGVFAPLLTVRDPIPVANATERTQVLSDLAAAGIVPAADEPVFVFRADAGSGRELEYTTDGSTWYTVRTSTAWATYTPTLSGFSGTVNRARWIDVDGMVTVQVAITLSGTPSTSMRVSLPVTAAAVSLTPPVGVATGHTGTQTRMGPVIIPTTTQMGVRDTSTAEWNASTPFAWAAGHVLGITATYERA